MSRRITNSNARRNFEPAYDNIWKYGVSGNGVPRKTGADVIASLVTMALKKSEITVTTIAYYRTMLELAVQKTTQEINETTQMIWKAKSLREVQRASTYLKLLHAGLGKLVDLNASLGISSRYR